MQNQLTKKIFLAIDNKYLLAVPRTILDSYITNGMLRNFEAKEVGNET